MTPEVQPESTITMRESAHGDYSEDKVGLAFWMRAVIEEWSKAKEELSEPVVHDLRVAIRRCRSMSDEMIQLDPHPTWKTMNRQGRKLFKALGSLRDAQVLMEWIAKIAPEEDPVSVALMEILRRREADAVLEAGKAVKRFDDKRWAGWVSHLDRRLALLPPEGLVFQHQALKRWRFAHDLHRQAVRDRTKTAYHRLRVGVKRFRYVLENFLPTSYAKWGRPLKKTQDYLGDMHDLDILWITLPLAGPHFDSEARRRWNDWIYPIRQKRLQAYRRQMIGPKGLWPVWRQKLPSEEQLSSVGVACMRARSLFTDPSFGRTERVSQLVLHLFSKLTRGRTQGPFHADQSAILESAALLRNCRGTRKKKLRKSEIPKEIRRISTPMGWNVDDLDKVALIVRYSRRGEIDLGDGELMRYPFPVQRSLLGLAGLLRLGVAIDEFVQGEIERVEVRSLKDAIVIRIQSAASSDSLFFEVAPQKILLEWACDRPIHVVPVYQPVQGLIE